MTSIFDFSSFPTLTTERLELRAITADDAPAMMTLFSDPQVLRFLNNPPTDTLEKALGFIHWLNDQYQNHAGVNWAISLNGDLIGMCGTYHWERENRSVEIGYHVLPSHWGKGYATEATHAMLRWCFDSLNVHRIQADCTDGNLASERVLLKCGFRVEGLFRESCWEHERFVDIKYFGLLRREYSYPVSYLTAALRSTPP